MTAREFRKFKEKNKLTTDQLADILMQSKDTIYAKLCGNRKINLRDLALLNQSKTLTNA